MAAGYNIYSDGSLIATTADGVLTIDLSGLMTEGRHTVGIARVDAYGNESDPLEQDVRVDGAGNIVTELIDVLAVSAKPIAGGYVKVAWAIETPANSRTAPASVQVAIDDLSTILATVNYAAQTSAYSATLGPFATGRTVTPAVRVFDGLSLHGVWLAANPVVADAAGPVAPTLV